MHRNNGRTTGVFTTSTRGFLLRSEEFYISRKEINTPVLFSNINVFPTWIPTTKQHSWSSMHDAQWPTWQPANCQAHALPITLFPHFRNCFRQRNWFLIRKKQPRAKPGDEYLFVLWFLFSVDISSSHTTVSSPNGESNTDSILYCVCQGGGKCERWTRDKHSTFRQIEMKFW